VSGRALALNLSSPGSRIFPLTLYKLWEVLCCRPQNVDRALCRNFLEPVFMVQSTENVLDSDPASGWQFMPTHFRGS